MKKLIILFALVYIPVTQVLAQVKTKDIGNEDITIVKEYQPVLNDAFKINILPEGDNVTSEPIKLNYSIEPNAGISNFNLTPIKPVRIKDDNIKKLYKGFAKLGYGLENMPMLDVYLNSLRSKDFELGFKYQHLSSTGKIKDYGDPNNSSNILGLDGVKYFQNFSLNANLNYNRRVVHYYGFNSPPDIFSKSETKHRVNLIGANIGFENNAKKTDEWKVRGGIDFYNLSNNRSLKENNVGLNLGVGKFVQDGYFGINGQMAFMGIDNNDDKIKRSFIQVQPSFRINKTQYTFEVGGNVTYERNDGDGDVHLHPVIKGSYEIISDAVTVNAEISGNMIRNDMNKFLVDNPFLFTPYFLELRNTNRKIMALAGTTIKLSQTLMFNGEVSYQRLKNMSFNVNYFNPIDFPVTYLIGYDDVNLFNVRLALNYQLNQKIIAGTSVDINSFDTKDLEHPLYIPLARFGLNLQYNIAEKIYAKLDLFSNSGAYGLKYETTGSLQVIEANYFKLKNYMDANLTVDYRYTKLISIFASLNNLGFSQYFRFYQYPSYRFNGMIGATISF